MKIHGINKLTLLDYPEKNACTIFTGGCNYRCPFCQNASLVIDPDSQPTLDQEEFFEFLEKRKNVLEGVCITGGEPTCNGDLPEFIQKIKNMGYLVKLDTNGDNFQMLKKLVDANLLDYVAMDVKNSLPRYGETIGIPNYNTANVEKSIGFLLNSEVDFEFRTTVAVESHDNESFIAIGKLISGAKKYFLQAYKLSDGLLGKPMTPPSKDQLEAFANIVKKDVGTIEIRGI